MAYDAAAVADSVIAYKKGITLQQGRALRDNPIEMAGGATDAPVVQAGWHPYDMVEYGDGADGVIYDGDVDGSVATITSPAFADGYEYRFIGVGLNLQTAATDRYQVDIYRETSGAYAGYQTIATYSGGSQVAVFDLTISPRNTLASHSLIGAGGNQATGNSAITGAVALALTWHHATAQKITGVRFRNDTRNTTAGTIRMYRRLLP